MLGRSHCRSGQLGNREQMVVLRICTLFVEPSHTFVSRCDFELLLNQLVSGEKPRTL
jgi:hypothetical protein